MPRLTLAIIITLLSAEAFSEGVCTRGYYALTCRGGNISQEIIDKSTGLNRGLRWHVYQLENILFIKKSPVRSINGGANLSAGNCAWRDRVIKRNEPGKLIYYTFQGAAKYNSVKHVLIDQLNRCAHDNNCIYRLCVQNKKGRYFKVNFSRTSFTSKR